MDDPGRVKSQRSQPASAGPAGETDVDLLAYMSMASADANGARAAWAEFYNRHAGYLYAVCLRAYGPLLDGEAGAADLVAETFRRVYENADKFDDAGIVDPDAARRRTRAWLGRIAQRIAQSELRGRSRLSVRLLDRDQWPTVPQPMRRPPADNDRIRRVRAAIESLSPREQTVIRVTFQWYEPGKEHQRLANDVAADLAQTLGTTSENLRQIRRRALAKIRQYLAAFQQAEKAGPEQ